MQYLKRFLLVVLAVVALLLAGFVVWASIAMRPGALALDALRATDTVIVNETPGYLSFQPTQTEASIGLIFYPGARVDYRAYAPVMRTLAEQGYLVVVVPVRLNMALFDVEAASSVPQAFPQIETWAVGGHSLGGVAAAMFAREQAWVSGLVLWAAAPVDESPRANALQVLTISASLDRLFPPENVEAVNRFYPQDSRFLVIAGGNHAQFGDYGSQPGDLPATISPEEQWTQIARATADFLQSLAP